MVNHPWGTIPLGSVFGIPVRLHGECLGMSRLYKLQRARAVDPHSVLLPAAVLFLGTFALALISQVNDGYRVLWAAVIFGPVLLLTILVHELGHCLASKKVLLDSP